MSFIRSEHLRLNRRRYELSIDSWFILRQPYRPLVDENNNEPDPESDLPAESINVTYICSDSYLTTGRPYTPRLEVEMQITFRFSQLPDRRRMHAIHILSAIKLISYIVQNGSPDPYHGYNPLQEDLPLLLFRPHALRFFDGPTILHFVFRQIYLTLVHINPSGRFCYFIHMLKYL